MIPGESVDQIRAEYVDTLVQASSGPDGTLFAVPRFWSAPYLLYRKSMFEDAGHGDAVRNWATDPPQYEEFTQVVKDTWEQSGTEHGFIGRLTSANLSWNEWTPTVHAFGGSLYGGYDNTFTKDFGMIGNRPITLTEEPAVEATRVYQSWVQGNDDRYPKICPEAVVQWGYPNVRQLFLAEKAPLALHWSFAPFKDEFGDDLGIWPHPYGVTESEATYDGFGGPVNVLSSWVWTVNDATEHADAVGEVMQRLSTQEFALFETEEYGNLPPSTDWVNTDRFEQTPVGTYTPTVNTLLAEGIPQVASPVYGDQMSQVATEVTAAMKGQQSATEAMENANEALTQIEENFNQ
jgi:ABC-type glycerol-3-phosphate transport system substrate-binding protein